MDSEIYCNTVYGVLCSEGLRKHQFDFFLHGVEKLHALFHCACALLLLFLAMIALAASRCYQHYRNNIIISQTNRLIVLASNSSELNSATSSYGTGGKGIRFISLNFFGFGDATPLLEMMSSAALPLTLFGDHLFSSLLSY